MHFDHTTVVDEARDYHRRLFLELAWHSQRDQNAGNEHIGIPDINRLRNARSLTQRSRVLLC